MRLSFRLVYFFFVLRVVASSVGFSSTIGVGADSTIGAGSSVISAPQFLHLGGLAWG